MDTDWCPVCGCRTPTDGGSLYCSEKCRQRDSSGSSTASSIATTATATAMATIATTMATATTATAATAAITAATATTPTKTDRENISSNISSNGSGNSGRGVRNGSSPSSPPLLGLSSRPAVGMGTITTMTTTMMMMTDEDSSEWEDVDDSSSQQPSGGNSERSSVVVSFATASSKLFVSDTTTTPNSSLHHLNAEEEMETNGTAGSHHADAFAFADAEAYADANHAEEGEANEEGEHVVASRPVWMQPMTAAAAAVVPTAASRSARFVTSTTATTTATAMGTSYVGTGAMSSLSTLLSDAAASNTTATSATMAAATPLGAKDRRRADDGNENNNNDHIDGDGDAGGGSAAGSKQDLFSYAYQHMQNRLHLHGGGGGGTFVKIGGGSNSSSGGSVESGHASNVSHYPPSPSSSSTGPLSSPVTVTRPRGKLFRRHSHDQLVTLGRSTAGAHASNRLSPTASRATTTSCNPSASVRTTGSGVAAYGGAREDYRGHFRRNSGGGILDATDPVPTSISPGTLRKRVPSAEDIKDEQYVRSLVESQRFLKDYAKNRYSTQSSSIPTAISTTEVDPSEFMRQGVSNFSMTESKLERNEQFVDELLQQSWFAKSPT